MMNDTRLRLSVTLPNLLVIVRRANTASAELVLAWVCIGWGGMFAMNPERMQELAHLRHMTMLPAWVWGHLGIVVGLVMLWGVSHPGLYGLRRWAAIACTALWLTQLTSQLLSGVSFDPLLPITGVLTISAAWVQYRVAVNGANGPVDYGSR